MELLYISIPARVLLGPSSPPLFVEPGEGCLGVLGAILAGASGEGAGLGEGAALVVGPGAWGNAIDRTPVVDPAGLDPPAIDREAPGGGKLAGRHVILGCIENPDGPGVREINGQHGTGEASASRARG
jgi:hypothetical protein